MKRPLLLLCTVSFLGCQGPLHVSQETLLKPEDFADGIEVLEFNRVKKTEKISVIAVHATQSLSNDALNFSFDVQNLSAPDPDSFTFRRAESSPLEQLRRNHLSFPGAIPLQQGEESISPCVPPYSLGQTCTFWVLSSASGFSATDTRLAWISKNALWFVDKADNGTGDLTEAELQDLSDQLEKVAIPVNEGHFGALPDVDQNSKLIVIISSKLIDAGPNSGFVAYVAPWDLLPNGVFPGKMSNEGDFFYAIHPRALTKLGYSREEYFRQVMPSYMVHELKHLVSNSSRVLAGLPVEAPWIEEPSAVIAEELARQYANQAEKISYYGSDSSLIQKLSDPVLSNLRDFRIVYNGRPQDIEEIYGIYSLNFLFLWNVYENAKEDFLSAWTAGPSSGIPNLEDHSEQEMETLMTDFALELFYESSALENAGWPELEQRPLVNGDHWSRAVAIHTGEGEGEDAQITLKSTYNEKPYFWVIRYEEN